MSETMTRAEVEAMTHKVMTEWEIRLTATCLEYMASQARVLALADDLEERADSDRSCGRHGDATELLGIARLIRATIEGR